MGPPGLIVSGGAKKNVLIDGYEVIVKRIDPEFTLIHLRRIERDAALPADEMLFMDIPLNARVGAQPIERIPRIELIARE